MGIQVICSEPIYLIIKEYIAQNLCTVEEDSDICFVEKGMESMKYCVYLK